ncbi:hypothetical protein [Saccharopolyspora spinosa]|uniref:hypothetical protein n=1 Tax=Saccharopolyspora spinosa TaxID=60894 RepID=UPI00376EF739
MEALKEQGPLTVEQDAELVELQTKAAQQRQKQKERDATYHQARKATAARIAELEALAGQGPLTVEQEAELAELQTKAAQQKQKHNESAAKYRRAGMAAAARVAVLEELKEQGRLTEEQAAELAELQPKAQQWRKKKEEKADWYRAGMAAAARVAELEGLEGLTGEQGVELAALRPKVARRKQQRKESEAKYHRAMRAAADRVAELEALAGRGSLTEEQEAELAELRPKVARRKQQKKYGDAKYHRAMRAAADRVAELEALAGRGPLTEEQEAELAELQPKAQQRKQKKKEENARYRRAGKAAVDRVAVLEELAEQGPLTEEQEAELAVLRPKVAQQRQKQKEYKAKYHRAGKAAVDRVAVLEELAEQGPLTEEQEAELAELRPKVAQQRQKQKEHKAKYHRAGKAAADRVAELEALAAQGQLTVEQEAELAELRPKAQQWQKQKERDAERRRARKVAADRVAVLEGLKEQGRLTEEQEAELAALRLKVAGRGRKKKAPDVTETGVSGAPLVGRGAGPEGVSGWTGADQDDLDVWSADVDLGAWLDQAVADLGGVRVSQGAADAGVMLGEGAYGEFVADELPAFLGQDPGDDAAGVGSVAGGLISRVSSPTTSRGRVPLGCLGLKALTVCFSVSRLRRMRCGLLRGMWWGLGCGGLRVR